jgi:hypothetical protein
MHPQVYALIKKKTKLSSYVRKFRCMGSGEKVIYEEGFLIYEENRKFFPIYEEAGSHI